MPTYTYRCTKCGHEFERFQSMSDEPVKRCEKCRSKVQRVFHPVGIVLKGSGFHRNDYRTGSGSSSESSSKDSESSSETKSSESKSESSSSDKKSDSKKSETKKSDSKASSEN